MSFKIDLSEIIRCQFITASTEARILDSIELYRFKAMLPTPL